MKKLQTIGTLATPGILLASALVALWLRLKKPKDTLQEDTAALRRIEEQIEAAAIGIVSEIETTYGGKGGELKRAAAIERVIALIPEKWRGEFGAEVIAGYVEDALSAAKIIWAKLNRQRMAERAEQGPGPGVVTVSNGGEDNVTITVDIESLDDGGAPLESGESQGEAVEVRALAGEDAEWPTVDDENAPEDAGGADE